MTSRLVLFVFKVFVEVKEKALGGDRLEQVGHIPLVKATQPLMLEDLPETVPVVGVLLPPTVLHQSACLQVHVLVLLDAGTHSGDGVEQTRGHRLADHPREEGDEGVGESVGQSFLQQFVGVHEDDAVGGEHDGE